MNPERKTSYGDLVVKMEVDGEWVTVGNAKTVEIKLESNEKIKKLNLYNNFGGISGTLHSVTIDFESPLLKKMRLGAELNHLLDVIKYARHSKKLDKAYKKYAELYEEYLDIE